MAASCVAKPGGVESEAWCGAGKHELVPDKGCEEGAHRRPAGMCSANGKTCCRLAGREEWGVLQRVVSGALIISFICVGGAFASHGISHPRRSTSRAAGAAHLDGPHRPQQEQTTRAGGLRLGIYRAGALRAQRTQFSLLTALCARSFGVPHSAPGCGKENSSGRVENNRKAAHLQEPQRRLLQNEDEDVPLALILGISIPVALVVIGLMVACLVYRHRHTSVASHTTRKGEERAETQNDMMKTESTVSAEMVFADVDVDPPAGPGDPAATTRMYSKEKDKQKEFGTEIGLGPVFHELKANKSGSWKGTASEPGTSSASTVAAATFGEGVSRDEKQLAPHLLSHRPHTTAPYGAKAIGSGVLEARRYSEESTIRGGGQRGVIPPPHSGGWRDGDIRLNGDMAFNAQIGLNGYAGAGRLPSTASMLARTPSGSNMPRVLSHRTPTSARPETATRDHSSARVDRIGECEWIGVSNSETPQMRRHHRKPHLPERQHDDAQGDDAARQTLVNLQLLRGGPGIAPPMPLANSTGNDTSMSHWVQGKAGAGSPVQHQAKPAGSARALPRTPDPVSPRPHSPLARVGEVSSSEGAWDWHQSPAAPCLSNATEGVDPAAQIGQASNRAQVAQASRAATGAHLKDTQPLPPPQVGGPGRQRQEQRVIGLDPDTMQPLSLHPHSIHTVSSTTACAYSAPPTRIPPQGRHSPPRSPCGTISDGRGGGERGGTYSMPRSSRHAGRESSFASFRSWPDESDEDGEGGLDGIGSGRSSPAYSESSRKSQDSIRCHDGWRNGFRTRANSQMPRRLDSGRQRIMELHKEMFAQRGNQGVNLATPLELPGDKGVSFYQGSSSLAGRMHKQTIDNAVSGFKDRPPPIVGIMRDEDEVWG